MKYTINIYLPFFHTSLIELPLYFGGPTLTLLATNLIHWGNTLITLFTVTILKWDPLLMLTLIFDLAIAVEMTLHCYVMCFNQGVIG